MPIIELKKISEAAEKLRQGQVVIYPTESSYALGCDAGNAQAVAMVYKLKERDRNKPLLVVADSLAMVKRYVVFSKTAKPLAEKFWPGSLTLVLPRKQGLAKNLNVGAKTLGVRVSENRTARKLAQLVGRPLVATSANVSGQASCYSMRAIKRAFATMADDIYVLNKGTLPRRKASTVVECSSDQSRVLRRGTLRIVD